MSAASRTRTTGVILDLFGTIVSAPSGTERLAATTALAECMRVPLATVDKVMADSWRQRHDGHLTNTTEVATYLVRACEASPSRVGRLEARLAELAGPRLRADRSVLRTIEVLRGSGIRIAVLSDAASDVVDAWASCELSKAVDAAVFSCRVGRLKPHLELYATALDLLGVTAQSTLYCGDGGGAELRGAQRAGMHAIRVQRRGGPDGLAYGELVWRGTTISRVEELPTFIASGWSK